MVEAAGIFFIPLLPEADAEVGQFFAKHPEVHEKEPLEKLDSGLRIIFCPSFPRRQLVWRWPCMTFLPMSF
jgi:hypothetical protein